LTKTWRLKDYTVRPLIDCVPIKKRIEWIILSVLRERGGEANPDDIFSAIFTILRNDLTPENEEILTVLRRLAEPVRNNKGCPNWRLMNQLEKGIDQSIVLQEHHDYILKVMSSIGRKFDLDIWIVTLRSLEIKN
jgi:hypothetical protein